MELHQEKKVLRQRMTIFRNQLNSKKKQDYDKWSCSELEKLIDERGFNVIHTYLPMGKEINITPLIENLLGKGKIIVCPKTLPNRKLENRVLTSLDKIEKGVFGTTHPLSSEEYTGNIDLIIVPGLAFDKSNYRLGYGGGYYDSFMENYINSYKIGYAILNS